MKAQGEFSVNLQPLDGGQDGGPAHPFNSFSIGKTFSGDLIGTSAGQMLSINTGIQGSAGYVALEYVTGTLANRTGSFVLQHYGIMSQGRDRLILEVVPDSGEGDFIGLTGSMNIIVTGGRHYYELTYELIAQPA